MSVGTLLILEGDKCKDARIVLGEVAPIPWRVRNIEDALKGKTIDIATAEAAGQLALTGAKPLTMNAYKIPYNSGTGETSNPGLPLNHFKQRR